MISKDTLIDQYTNTSVHWHFDILDQYINTTYNPIQQNFQVYQYYKLPNTLIL